MRQLAVMTSCGIALMVLSSATAQAAAKPAATNAVGAKALPADSNEPGALFDKLDANHDGRLTADEIPAEKKGLFTRLLRLAGKPADGKLSRDEFIAQLKTTDSGPSEDSASGNSPPTKPAEKSNGNPSAGKPAGGGTLANRPLLDPERIFSRLDTKGKGQITLDDVPEQRRPFLKRVFVEAGKGEGGSLTKEEFIKAFKAVQAKIVAAGGPAGPIGAPPAAGDASQRLKRLMAMSKRSDGKLTKDDLPERLRDRFDKIDANHDGLIDEQELRDWLAKVQQRLQAAENK